MRRQLMISAGKAEDGFQSGGKSQPASSIRVAVITPGLCLCLLGAIMSTSGVFSKRNTQVPGTDENRADRSIKACTGLVLTTRFVADSRTVAIAGSDKSLKLWDIDSGRVRQIPQEFAVRCLTLSSDGRRFATCYSDKEVHLYDTASGVRSFVLRTPDPVRLVAFDPRGELLAAGHCDGSITVWDLESRRPRLSMTEEVLEQGSPPQFPKLVSMIYSPDGKTLIAGSGDGRIRMWDSDTGHLRGEWIAHTTAVDVLAITPQGNTLASATCLEREVKLWELPTGRLRTKFRVEDIGVKALEFALDGATLTSVGAAKNFRVWDVRTGRVLARLRGSDGWGWTLNYSRDGNWLVSGGTDGMVGVWRTNRLGSQAPSVASRCDPLWQ